MLATTGDGVGVGARSSDFGVGDAVGVADGYGVGEWYTIVATQQYVAPGLRFLNVANPGDLFGAGSVVSDANGVPGRGFADDFGVEIKTGTWYCGRPASVT